jgi:hypothetical protein
VSAVILLFREKFALVLDRDGLETTRLFQRYRVCWKNVSELCCFEFRHVTMVGFNDKNLSSAYPKFSLWVLRRNAWLPDTYGLSADDLLALMTRWRERALSHQIASVFE